MALSAPALRGLRLRLRLPEAIALAAGLVAVQVAPVAAQQPSGADHEVVAALRKACNDAAIAAEKVYGLPPNCGDSSFSLDRPLILIDGPTGNVIGNHQYPRSTRVRVVVRNINPFLYQYSLGVDSALSVEPSIADFFKVLFGLDLGLAPPDGDKDLDATPQYNMLLGLGDLVNAECPAGTSRDLLDRAKLRLTSIESGISSSKLTPGGKLGLTLQRLLDAITFHRERRIASHAAALRIETNDGNAVHHAAQLLLRDLRYPEEFVTATTDARTLASSLFAAPGWLTSELDDAATTFKGCKGFERFHPAIADLRKDSAMAAAILAKADDFQAALTALADKVEDTDRFDSYYMERWVGGHGGVELVTIRVSRKPVARIVLATGRGTGQGQDHGPPQQGSGQAIASPLTINVSAAGVTPTKPNEAQPAPGGAGGGDGAFRLLYEERLRIGGRNRFTIGAGFAWGGVPTREFGLTDRFVPPPVGVPGDTVAKVVVATERSNSRVLPVLTFSMRLHGDWLSDNVSGVYAVFGGGVRPDQSLTDWQFMTGLGLGLFRERCLLLVGVLVANSKELSSPYRVGDRAPTGTSTNLSRKVLKAGLALGVSIKIL